MTTPTERLYYDQQELFDFRARVVELADDGRRVYLDRTAFYPTSGGQPHDVGTLGGVRVVDVVDEGARVAHLLDAPLPPDAREVGGRVDEARRRDLMQQHTGQHLLSAVLLESLGWGTVSVHFGDAYDTVDLSVSPDEATPERLAAAQARCNALVARNLPVVVSYADAAEATGLRRPSSREGTLRLVTIDGVDRSACGGTHVAATGAIGVVLLRRAEKVKQGTRIEFVCGERAAARARRDYELLAATARPLSTSVDDLPQAVGSLSAQLKDSEQRRRALEADAAAAGARALHEATVPDAAGVRRALERREVPGDRVKDAAEQLRATALAYALCPKGVYVGVAAPADGGAVSIVVAASDDSGVDAGGLLREALAPVGGRGGGSSRLAQGSVAGDARLATVMQALGVMT